MILKQTVANLTLRVITLTTATPVHSYLLTKGYVVQYTFYDPTPVNQPIITMLLHTYTTCSVTNRPLQTIKQRYYSPPLYIRDSLIPYLLNN